MDVIQRKRAFNCWSILTALLLTISLAQDNTNANKGSSPINALEGHRIQYPQDTNQRFGTPERFARSIETEDENAYSSDEGRLISALLSRFRPYKKLARPVRNASQTVDVHFGLDLKQILDLDEKDQVLETRIWKEYKWHDETMIWDPADYGGCHSIGLPKNNIWVPDIILWNNLGEKEMEEHKELVVASYDGTVLWVPSVNYKSSCEVDMTYYPFDVQKCKLQFGSWTHNANQINLQSSRGVQVDMTYYPFDVQTCVLQFGSWSYNSKQIDLQLRPGHKGMSLEKYVRNAEWDITENVARLRLLKYECCEELYSDLTFSLTLKRRISFQIKLMILPTLLLSVISLFIFWIPVHRPDRTALGMSLFSSFFLLLILIFSTSPSTSTAKIGHFFSIVILLVAFGIMLSVFNINLSQSVRPMPKILEMIVIGHLGKFLCPDECKIKTKGKENTVVDSNPSANKEQYADSNCFYSPIRSEKYKIRDPEANRSKWKIFGVVLDRFFFVFYFCTLFFSYIFVFPKPHMIAHLM